MVTAGLRAEPQVTLVAEGEPRAVIVLADRPTRSAQLAARELQHHIQLITGARLSVTNETGRAPGLYPLFLGGTRAAAEMGLDGHTFLPQEYALAVNDARAVLVGLDDQDFGSISYEANGAWPGIDFDSARFQVGTLYAVYDFLERECGVRWYMVTEGGTVFDQQPTLTVPTGRRRYRPWTQYRRLGQPSWSVPGVYGKPDQMGYSRTSAFASARDATLYALRTRQNAASFKVDAHTLRVYNRDLADSHPDWFVNGKPGPDVQLRLWRPEVVDRVAGDVIAYFNRPLAERQAPHDAFLPGKGDLCTLGPLDNRSFDDQDVKSRLDAARTNAFFGDGRASDYWFGFVNQVAGRVLAVHPGKWIASPAYASHYEPPTFPLHSNIAVYVAMADGWDEQGYGMRTLRAWRDRVSRLLTYEYGYMPDFPKVQPEVIAGYTDRLRALGVEGCFMERISGSEPALHHINHYLMSRLLFDTDGDARAILDEYFRRFYGPAERPMRAFWTTLMRQSREVEAWKLESKRDLLWDRVGSRRMLETLEAHLVKAEQCCGKDDPYAWRVRIVRQGILGMMEERVGLARNKLQRGRRLTVPLAGSAAPLDASAQPFVTAVGRPAAPRTNVRAWRRDDRLELAFDCAEPQPEAIRTACTANDDRRIEQDDHVEIALDVARGRTRYHRLVINSEGALLDEIVTATYGTTWRDAHLVKREQREAWASGAEVQAARTADGWTLRVSIPLKNLTTNAIAQGMAWGANFARVRPHAADTWNAPRLSMWAPTFEAFGYPDRFGVLEMRQEPSGSQPVLAYDFDDDFPAAGFVRDRAGPRAGGGTNGSPGRLRVSSQGTPYSASNRVAGVKGTAIRFYGKPSGQHLQAQVADGVNLAQDDFTVAFWMRSDAREGTVLSGSINTRGDRPWWTVNYHPLGLLSTLFGSGLVDGEKGPQGGLNSKEAYTRLGDGHWHHVVFMVDRGRNTRLYLDGELMQYEQRGEMTPVRQPFLGILSIGGYWSPLNGAVDEFRVYQGTFGQREVDLWHREFKPAP